LDVLGLSRDLEGDGVVPVFHVFDVTTVWYIAALRWRWMSLLRLDEGQIANFLVSWDVEADRLLLGIRGGKKLLSLGLSLSDFVELILVWAKLGV
jgi:hypothetical protein